MKPAICCYLRAISLADFRSGWLYEAGIGENRALLIADGEAVQMRIERDDQQIVAGAIVDGKFTRQWVAGQSGIVTLASGEEILLQPLASGVTEGARVRVEITRPALSEQAGQHKRAKARPAAANAILSDGPSLLDEIGADGLPLRQVHSHEADLLGQYNWHEWMEQAQTGQISFDGGMLLISLTPAMVVIDVDGPLTAPELANRAAREIALALVRLDIGGNIAVDFPTLTTKAQRSAVAVTFDQYFTGQGERTAINGFGLMQIIRRKTRRSALEIAQDDPVLTALLGRLRQAEREHGSGDLALDLTAAMAEKLAARPDWLAALARRTGRTVVVRR